ncbi:MAG: hypothetical protein IKW00_00975 [Clostridia bacterium]|nr:hypothetical protein [Clostridia bacterium]
MQWLGEDKFIPDFFYENCGLLPHTTQPFFHTFQKTSPLVIMPTGFLLGPQYYSYFSFNQDVACPLAEKPFGSVRLIFSCGVFLTA